MWADLGAMEIAQWVTNIFPSLYNLFKILGPVIFLGVAVFSIFSNILPEPGVTYPVPDKRDIATELKDRSFIIYYVTLVTLYITIQMNKFIVTANYRRLYTILKFCIKITNRIRGKTKSSKIKPISNPVPYQMDLDLFDKE